MFYFCTSGDKFLTILNVMPLTSRNLDRPFGKNRVRCVGVSTGTREEEGQVKRRRRVYKDRTKKLGFRGYQSREKTQVNRLRLKIYGISKLLR